MASRSRPLWPAGVPRKSTLTGCFQAHRLAPLRRFIKAARLLRAGLRATSCVSPSALSSSRFAFTSTPVRSASRGLPEPSRAGRIINATTARSQLLGGMIWGIGSALHEATEIDRRSARYVNDNLGEYLIPVNADVPSV